MSIVGNKKKKSTTGGDRIQVFRIVVSTLLRHGKEPLTNIPETTEPQGEEFKVKAKE
jgi:hypothetical protein